ncbi:hypothetical protein TNCV_1286891 [Trichonephila clavipes]|nr:hypothetical protein TNCV_1286891 [Trichonephila clavipes]
MVFLLLNPLEKVQKEHGGRYFTSTAAGTCRYAINEHIYDKTLIRIGYKVFTMVGKKHDFRTISPRRADGNDFDNEIARELHYDFIAL